MTNFERVRRILHEMRIHEDRIAPDATIAGLSMSEDECREFAFRLENEFAIAIVDEHEVRTLQDVAEALV